MAALLVESDSGGESCHCEGNVAKAKGCHIASVPAVVVYRYNG